MSLYPGFSADFYDTLHNVVVSGILSLCPLSHTCTHGVILKIGGSYVTTPRQAERRTLRNFFQRNYPYSWIGGRVVYDAAK
jgi:L-histidine Nalpha-methyltransferase / hercynylcysteine S-oxide synthase